MGQSAVPPVEEPYSAHYMDTYHDTRRLIVVDGPKEESVQKWWLMVWDEDVTYIVNLSPRDEEVIEVREAWFCMTWFGIFRSWLLISGTASINEYSRA